MVLHPTWRRKGPEPRLPYQWAIEGDIQGCFDNISHHGLMQRVRLRVGDAKVNKLVKAFLKAGVLSENQYIRTENGTPQGGILSPLLSNIALTALDERYERYVWPRRTPTLLTETRKIVARAHRNRQNDKVRRGQVVFMPVRYADDFIVLVGAPPGPNQMERAQQAALEEKASLETYLKESMGLELSGSKTLITPVTKPMRFLGHHLRVRRARSDGRYRCCALIPREKTKRLRELIRRILGRSTQQSTLKERLLLLNPLLRGWSSYYRYASGAKRVFSSLDLYVWKTILRWLRRKHNAGARVAAVRHVWRKPGRRAIRWSDGDVSTFQMARLRVRRFRMVWLRPPRFCVNTDGEPGA
jgi:group II intron reverse transcriptase/maturase